MQAVGNRDFWTRFGNRRSICFLQLWPQRSTDVPGFSEKIDTYAFAECPHITEITLPEGNATIEYAAFTGDTGVQKIKIPLSEIQFDDLNNEGYYIFTNYKQNKLETIIVGTAPNEKA